MAEHYDDATDVHIEQMAQRASASAYGDSHTSWDMLLMRQRAA